MKKSIRFRLYTVIGVIVGVSGAIMLAILVLLQGYNNRYGEMLYNITTASEFNQEFKNNIDQEMYYYVVESRYSEGLPVEEVRSAQELARNLLKSTKQQDSFEAISSVLDLCQTLETKMNEIAETRDFDERMTQLENNVYVLSSLIEEYMYSYLYFEAVNLNSLHQTIKVQVSGEIIAVAIFTAAFIVAALYYAFRFSNSITKPLETLCSRAKEVTNGNLSERGPIETDSYEIRTLSEGMEQMIVRLNQQIQEAADRQQSLRKTELALLQAQINPHFLYNTMDTIIWLIEAEKNGEAVEMVSNLSNFFRHSLSKGEDVITLAEEERHVRSYLQIQHVRYKDILSYEVDIDPELKNAMIPKLTLQPLVENALYHGIKLKRAKGLIRILGSREGDDVILKVIDNGIGMSPERLEALQNAISNEERIGFGFSAVNQRLKLQFGREYGLSVTSTEGEGTEVTVRIRYREKEEVRCSENGRD